MSDPIRCEGVAVRYPFATSDAVGPVSLRIACGERVLMLGPSGCGKSTLLHSLTGLIPHALPATRRGQISLFGQPVESRSPAEWAAFVAILFQDAEQTLAGFTVADEIAFSLENRGVAAATIAGEVARAMALAGLPQDWNNRRVATLSGGQKQLVALAAVLAQSTELIVADEPTASLAPLAANRLAEIVLAPGKTALVVDHRIGALLDRIDRVIVLGRDGKLLTGGTPEAVFGGNAVRLAAQGIWTPLAARLRLALVRAGHALPDIWRMEDLLGKLPSGSNIQQFLLPQPLPTKDAIVELAKASCAPPFGPVVLQDITLSLRGGEVLGVLGPNGAGKSTLGLCLAGLAPPRAGKRTGPIGAIAFQNPEAHFATDSTRAELHGGGMSAQAADAALLEWGLADVADQHPFTLSTGQKRRLALALVATTNRWPVIVLDEPTSGLDHAGSQTIARHIRKLAAAGRAVAIITHDADFALSVCDRIALVNDGRVMATGRATDILQDVSLLTKAGLAPPEAAILLESAGLREC